MASQNIQHLFSIIRPEQVEQYLKGKRWRSQKIGDRLVFDLPAEEHGEARQVFLPADPTHPRLRSLLPNVIFSLAVIYEREAIDIANDIADQVVVAPDATPNLASDATPDVAANRQPSPALPPAIASVPSSQLTVELVNSGPQTLTVRSRFSQEALELEIDQTLQVRCQAGTVCQLYLTSDCELDFRGSIAPQLLPGLPSELWQWSRRGWNVETGLANFLRTNMAPAAEFNDEGWIDALVAEFIFILGQNPTSIEPTILTRVTARFLMSIHRQFAIGKQPLSADLMLTLARVLLGIGRQVLVADSSSADSLMRLMALDNPDAPHKIVDWLSMHSRSL